MRAIVLGVGLFAGAFSACAMGEEVTTAELDGRIAEKEQVGDWQGAATDSEQLAGLLESELGAGNWRTLTRRQLTDEMKRVASAPPADSRGVQKATLRAAEATSLFRRGDRETFAKKRLNEARKGIRQIYGEQSLRAALFDEQFADQLQSIDFERSKSLQIESMKMCSTIPRMGGVVTAARIKKLGDLHLSNRDFAHAHGQYQLAIDAIGAAAVDNTDLVAQVLLKRAECERMDHRWPECRATLQAVLTLVGQQRSARDSTDWILTEAMARNGLGLLCQNESALRDAETMFDTALQLAKSAEGESSPPAAIIIANQGVTLYVQRRYSEAVLKFESALSIFEKCGISQVDRATIRRNLGDARLADGMGAGRDRILAEEDLRQALKDRVESSGEKHVETALVRQSLASLLLQEGRLDEAAREYETANAILESRFENKSHQDLLTSIIRLSQVRAAQGQRDEARRLLIEAVNRWDSNSENPLAAAQLSRELGWHAYDGGDYEAARKEWANAANAFERARMSAATAGLDGVFLTSEQSPALLLASCEARLGNPRGAWMLWEQGLARGLLDELVSRGRVDADAAANRRGKREFESAVEDLQSLDEVQRRIADDQAMIGWVDLPLRNGAKDPRGDHWIVVVRRTGEPQWIRLGDPTARWTLSDELVGQQLVDALVNSVTDPDQESLDEIRELIGELRAQRWDRPEIQAALSDPSSGPPVRRLLVLPSAALQGIPVELLVGDGLEVNYIPSATVHCLLLDRSNAHPAPEREAGFLAVGNPEFGPDVEQLPGSGREMRAVQRVFQRLQPAGSFRLVEGPAANPIALNELLKSGELQTFRFIHFTTHGIAEPRCPLRSRLLLSWRDPAEPGEREPDGSTRLTAEMMLKDWKLNAELVVLSACDSGLGRYARGEGYVGFPQALLIAGARSVVVSLWKANDRATVLLMTRFNENVLRPGERAMSPAAALHEAKLWLKSLSSKDVDVAEQRISSEEPGLTMDFERQASDTLPFEHPAYWAGFVLIGDSSEPRALE